MEEVTSKEDHVDIPLSSQAHDFMKALPAVVSPRSISFVVADMVV